MENLNDKIACKECGVILNRPKIDHDHQFHCPRCNACIYKFGQNYQLILLLAVTSLILFLPSVMLPLITLENLGLQETTTLLETLFSFFKNGYMWVSLFITIIGIVIPFVMLILILFILIPLHNGASPKKIRSFFKVYEYLKQWQMAEVYFISVFISIIKLDTMATLHIGVGLYFFSSFLFFMFLTIIFFNPHDIWTEDEV